MISSEINVKQNLFLDREGIIQKLTVFNVTTESCSFLKIDALLILVPG